MDLAAYICADECQVCCRVCTTQADHGAPSSVSTPPCSVCAHARLQRTMLIIIGGLVIPTLILLLYRLLVPPARASRWSGPMHFTIPILSPFSSVVCTFRLHSTPHSLNVIPAGRTREFFLWSPTGDLTLHHSRVCLYVLVTILRPTKMKQLFHPAMNNRHAQFLSLARHMCRADHAFFVMHVLDAEGGEAVPASRRSNFGRPLQE